MTVSPSSWPKDLEIFEQALLQSTPRVFITPSLLALNVAVYAAMVLTGTSVWENGPDLMRWVVNSGPMTIDHQQWWRLLTSTFLHIGIIHLAFNMWVLWGVGWVAERLFGNWMFLIVYILSGLGGSIANLLWNPNVMSVDASGPIFGIVGATIAFLVLSNTSALGAVIVGNLGGLVLFTVCNLFYGLSRDGIEIAGHIGGLTMGLALGALLRRPLPATGRQIGRKQIVVVMGALALLLVGVTQVG